MVLLQCGRRFILRRGKYIFCSYGFLLIPTNNNPTNALVETLKSCLHEAVRSAEETRKHARARLIQQHTRTVRTYL